MALLPRSRTVAWLSLTSPRNSRGFLYLEARSLLGLPLPLVSPCGCGSAVFYQRLNSMAFSNDSE